MYCKPVEKTVGNSLCISLLSQALALTALLFMPITSSAQNTNTDYGTGALNRNTTGIYNSAFGYYALGFNDLGNWNTASGYQALFSNSSGSYNAAYGARALFSNKTGNLNTACGYLSLYKNISGSWNTASGYQALYSNDSGKFNTATGYQALSSNIASSYNTASGYQALASNLAGNTNTAAGSQSLYLNNTGNQNTAIGHQALYSNLSGNYNIALGLGAGYNLTLSNNIAIGNGGVGTDAGVIRIGTSGTHTRTIIAGISGVTSTGGVAVYINSAGQLGTLQSSKRFKNDIKDMGKISEKLMQLRPVTFRYNDKAEQGSHPLQYGLIAEEVAKVYPDLVQYDEQGKPYTIYYHLLTPMILNELQKEHKRNEALENRVTALEKATKTEITALTAELASLKQVLAQLTKNSRVAPDKP